jgi:hypothetical protein
MDGNFWSQTLHNLLFSRLSDLFKYKKGHIANRQIDINLGLSLCFFAALFYFEYTFRFHSSKFPKIIHNIDWIRDRRFYVAIMII